MQQQALIGLYIPLVLQVVMILHKEREKYGKGKNI
jgi:hypothetical protein